MRYDDTATANNITRWAVGRENSSGNDCRNYNILQYNIFINVENVLYVLCTHNKRMRIEVYIRIIITTYNIVMCVHAYIEKSTTLYQFTRGLSSEVPKPCFILLLYYC